MTIYLQSSIGHAPDLTIRVTSLQIVRTQRATCVPFHGYDGCPFPDPAAGRSELMHQDPLGPSLSGFHNVDDFAHDERCHISEGEETLAYPIQDPLVSLLPLLSFS